MFGISMWELLLVGLVLFIAVGPAKLPGLAKQLGKGLKDLRNGINDIKGTVDKDDEFVKAVSEARQTVVDAKESFRSLIEDVVDPTDEEDEDDDAYEQARDPAPRGAPLGRKMVRSAPEDDEETAALPAPDEDESQAATSGDEPVEAEDYRASSKAVPVGRVAGDDAVPQRPARRSATGRKMIKPGRSRPHGSGDGSE